MHSLCVRSLASFYSVLAMNIAIIPARGGSKRIPRKNIRMFHGKPIIAYSIETAYSSCLFDRVYVSTEDIEIADVAKKNGADIIWRKPEYAEINAPDCGTQEVVRQALLEISNVDYACCIYPTAPMIDMDSFYGGYEMISKGTTPFAYSCGLGHDAGQWYWGTVKAFLDQIPLSQGSRIKVPEDTDCDINVEEDWIKAEELYALRRAHGHKTSMVG